MTPIEELKNGLDELGIKYTIGDSGDYEVIEWQGPYNLWWQFVYDPYEEESYGELRLLDTGGSTCLTPEQAIAVTVGERSPDGLPIGLTISNDGNLLNWMGENYVRQDAATVGSGTCHMRLVYEEEDADGFIWPDHYECDACGAKVNGIMPFYDTEIPPKHCPNCGRNVVSE